MDKDVLGPKQLEERGLGSLFGPPTPTTNPLLGEGTMAVTSGSIVRGGEMYTAEEDIIETLEDGRTIQVAVKGAQIPMSEALRLGLVKEQKQQGPSETKTAAQGGKETKAQLSDQELDEAEEQAKATAKAEKGEAKK